MPNKISMTKEEFNKLSNLLTEAYSKIQSVAATTELVYRTALAHTNGQAIICKIVDDLTKARDVFFEIRELLQKVKDNYANEITNQKDGKNE